MGLHRYSIIALLLCCFGARAQMFDSSQFNTSQLPYALTNVGTISNITVSGTARVNGALVAANTLETGGTSINASNTVQVDTPQLAKALQVDTNGNLYAAGNLTVAGTATAATLAATTANVGALTITNAATNFVTSGFYDTNFSTAKTVVLTNGTGRFDGNVNIWNTSTLNLHSGAASGGLFGDRTSFAYGGISFIKSATAYMTIGDTTTSPQWGFNPYISFRDGSGLGWSAAVAGTPTAMIKGITGTLYMSNNIIVPGTITATNGYYMPSNTTAIWPSAPVHAGDAYWGNSNGTIYLLQSIGSASWASTNKIGQ